MAHCTSCLEEIPHGEVRYAFDEVYCERCFDDLFTYCCRCDRLLYREDTQWDNDGDPFCAECYEEDNDECCPDNPEVFDADRQLIVELARGFLYDKPIVKSLIRINKNDHLLTKIRDKVGIVENSVYVYGIKDRDEYQISVSQNLIDTVKEFALKNGLDWKVNQDIGVNRIGISYSLRQHSLKETVKLIKYSASVREQQPA